MPLELYILLRPRLNNLIFLPASLEIKAGFNI